MPLSVTCQCGARLEIDDKFLGKEVPCPDCNRPLPTSPVVAPPPLDLPDYRRTSGLAVLSLALALVGMFTIVGAIAAIAVGLLAVKEISARPTRLEGMLYARAGIIVGIVGTFLTLLALVSPTVFGLDSFLRDLAYAGRIKWDNETIESTRGQDEMKMKRPSPDWGAYIPPSVQPNNLEADDIIMINPREDAYIGLFSFNLADDPVDNDDDRQKKVLEKFYRTELVSLLGRLQGKPLGREGTIEKTESVENDTKKEITLDLRLGGVDRRFLIQYRAKENRQFSVLVGAARLNNFDRLRDVFRKTFETKIPP